MTETGARTALVTGGSGYIAGFVIRQLIAEGWSVNTTVRSLAREAEVRGWLDVDNARLHFFAADLTSDAGWPEAVAGCSHVVHVASPLPTGVVRNADELVVPARDGALRALRFARDAEVERVVMTSSLAAIAYGHPDEQTIFTEADWTNLDDPKVQPYPRSKTVAERAARDWVAATDGAPELVTVNPSLVLGPVMSGDFSGSVEAITRLLTGKMPGLPPIGFGVVDVRDVADLHVRALTAPGISGERFIASGPFLMFADLARVLREQLGGDGAQGADAAAAGLDIAGRRGLRPAVAPGDERDRPHPRLARHPREGGAGLGAASGGRNHRRHREQPDRTGRGQGLTALVKG